MVQNCPNITNPSGSSHKEQLVPKRLTLVILIKVTIIILIICRRLVASRDVKPGEVVVVESSLILVPGMQVSFNSIIVLFFNFF